MLFAYIINTLGVVIYVCCEITNRLEIKIVQCSVLSFEDAAVLVATSHERVSHFQCTRSVPLNIDEI